MQVCDIDLCSKILKLLYIFHFYTWSQTFELHLQTTVCLSMNVRSNKTLKNAEKRETTVTK